MAETPSAGRIAVDAMGGDLGPAEVVAAAKLALAEYPALNPLTLVGNESVLQPLLAQAGLRDHPQLRLSHASEVITMDDKPLLAIRRKKDSSMMRAIELVKNGEAIAAVSCGNTGSLVAASDPQTPHAGRRRPRGARAVVPHGGRPLCPHRRRRQSRGPARAPRPQRHHRRRLRAHRAGRAPSRAWAC